MLNWHALYADTLGSRTDVGTQANTVVEDSVRILEDGRNVTFNYALEFADGVIEVIARPIIITAGSAEKQYDGTPLTCADYSITSPLESLTPAVAEGERAKVSTRGSITEIGKIPNVVDKVQIFSGSRDVTANYNIVTESGLLVVQIPDGMLYIKTHAAEKVYDGTPLTCALYECENTLPDTYSVEISCDGSVTNVNKVLNTVSVTVLGPTGENVSDYIRVEYEYGILAVTPRPILVETNSNSWPYDGRLHSDRGHRISDKSDYTLAQGHETRVYGYTYIFDVGVKTNVLDIGVVANGFDVSENYLIEYDYGFLEIVESDYEGQGGSELDKDGNIGDWGGQVYYVYNRVNNIADIAAQIAKLVPEANVAYAHGQMKEHELERIMFDFINGEIDVLVSTTIIETGLDISNVNTMIIHDSDNLGLSQLYQLRGRVGRSNRNAYAFLMYKRDKMLKEVAEKRLAAIKEFTDLGSGFKIAMRDLEIRGAGNLLGLSQHGHMEAVGYDLYCKMLNEAVQNLKGIHTAVDFATVIDLDVDAYIPAEYIVNETQKLDIYKRIAGIETIKERDEMKDELLDRFGNIPKAVDNLLRIALIRMAAHGLDMTEIKGKNERITFNFRPDAKIDPRKIPDFLKKHKDELSFTAYGNPFFTYKYKKTGLVETDAELLMGRTEELLEEMKELVLETEPVQNN